MSVSQGSYAIVVHGGAGGKPEYKDGCKRAARRAAEELGISGDALEAAIAAVTVLEDDGRFNAGRGSVLCLDGETVEMDASVMDTRGRLGAVACVRGIENPVLLARAVADTPHWFLAGDGADRFGAPDVSSRPHAAIVRAGLPPYSVSTEPAPPRRTR